MVRRVILMMFLLLISIPLEANSFDIMENRFYLFLQAGHFKGSNDAGKINADGSGYGYGLGGGYFLTHNLSVEGDFMYFTDDYVRDSTTFAPGTSSNNIEIASVSLAVNTKYFLRYNNLSFFIGGGIGFYDSDIYAQETGFSGKSNVDGDQATGYQGTIGIGYSYRDRAQIELVWRRIFLDQDFGVYSNGEADTGGDYFYLGMRGGYW